MLGLLYIMVSIPIWVGQTSNELRLQPFNPTQHWSCWRPWRHPTPAWGGPRRSTCLSLPRDLVLGRLSHLSLLGDPPAWGPRWSTCLDLPRDLVPMKLSCLNLLRDPPVQGFQEVNMPLPAQGPNSQEANMPQSAWRFDLQEVIMPQPAWGSAP